MQLAHGLVSPAAGLRRWPDGLCLQVRGGHRRTGHRARLCLLGHRRHLRHAQGEAVSLLLLLLLHNFVAVACGKLLCLLPSGCARPRAVGAAAFTNVKFNTSLTVFLLSFAARRCPSMASRMCPSRTSTRCARPSASSPSPSPSAPPSCSSTAAVRPPTLLCCLFRARHLHLHTIVLVSRCCRAHVHSGTVLSMCMHSNRRGQVGTPVVIRTVHCCGTMSHTTVCNVHFVTKC